MVNSLQKIQLCKLSLKGAGPYPERISYQLTGMCTQKKLSQKKQKMKFLKLPCLFIKKKFYTPQDFTGWPVWAPKKCHLKKKSFMKILKISLLIVDFTSIANVEKGSSVLTLLSTKQWNVFAPKSLDKLMIFETNCCNKLQLIALGISYRRITLGWDM